MPGLCSAHRDTTGLIRLEDPHHAMTLGVAPRAGNMAFSLTVHGHEILRFPFESIDDFLARGGGWQGIPFLAPWANRLDETAFYANGRRFAFDLELGNVRGPIPIHGLIANDPGWRVIDIGSTADASWVTSRLDFFADPLLMKQFPFAHTIDMTYRLGGGVLEVETRLSNMAAEPMPVSIGFHPYLKLTDSTRDEWRVAIGARAEWVLDDRKIPTGVTRPIERLLPNPSSTSLRDVDLDHVFGDLIRDAEGRSLMTVRGRAQRIDVVAGPLYDASVVYAPARPPAGQDRDFICFEPMAAITNAMNLAHRGQYAGLQSIPPAGTWTERFWVRPTGFV